jgi:arabinose-5-phosphate isomerase
VLNSVDALHGDVGIVNDGDVILALSYSGESEELLNLLPALKRFSVKIISLTGNRNRRSPAQRRFAERQSSEGSLPVQSRADEQHDGDARDGRRAGDGGVAGARFQAKDYARLHPSGAIGRAMLLQGRRHHAHGNRNAVAGENLRSRKRCS